MRLWCQLKNNNAQPCFYLVIQSGAVRRAWNPLHGTDNYPYNTTFSLLKNFTKMVLTLCGF